MTAVFTIEQEPSGNVYLAVVRFAASIESTFSLVWRHQLRRAGTADLLEPELRPHLIAETETDEWPGTKLLGHLATTRRYRMSPRAQEVLASRGSLYAWLTPFPEDLAFYSRKGELWLGSIAHEHDSYVVLGEADLRELQTHVPGLQLRYEGESA